MPPKQATMQRRAGLARDNRVRPLLSQVNGQRRTLVADDRPVDRPPDDSDDEITDPEPCRGSIPSKTVPSSKEASRVFSSTKPASDSDDDQSAWSSRANMARPYFGSSKRGKEQSKMWSASQESSQGQAQCEGSQGSFSTTRGSKRNSPDGGALSPESKVTKARKIDLDDEKEAKRLLVRKKSYGRGENNRGRIRPPTKSKPWSSQERPISKLGKEASAPKMVQPSFKAYDDDPFDQFLSQTPPKRIIEPAATFLSSPPHASAHPVLKHVSLSPHSSPKRKAKAEFKLPSASLPESLQNPTNARPQLRNLESSPESDLKKTRKFSFESSDLSDLDSDLKQLVEARCPMCNEIVDEKLLHDFSKGARLHIRKQIQFCRLHKKKSAEKAWDARGYPKIDWEGLDTRIATHYSFLGKVINGGSSHFGDLLLDKVKEGKNRTLLKAEDSLTPGYYGPRGLRAFSEHIIGRFSSILRERAVDDRLISSRGYSSYVEAVLVPELAVLLISDDMVVEAEEARSILEESKWIGDLLHEDTGDTVDQLSDDEKRG
ncbi:RTC4-like domain-containing protein [Colletotrichum acutatum]|uniref:Restriction of telomere capping protein 4 n=1 Tax=Glomerella acutata TaxID=27357 RepID=A0AAD8UPE4_GLOAC|nr:RTC4-like domain-containing protein [Colletotrichum acutatum]KAK1724030.1 RTC4-like domain-containing protein [Colletotrichum acutatum]